MGGRGASSTTLTAQKRRIEDLDKKIAQAKKWGDKAYKDELKKTNEILATAARKLEYKMNGYHQLIADRTKAKKQLAVMEKIKKGKQR